MMYRPGKMGIAEGFSLSFILTFVPVFLSIWSITVDKAKTAAWVVPLVNGPLVMITVLGVIWVMKHHGGDLLDSAETLFGRKGVWLIGLVYILQFFTEAVLLLREFAENTLLTALPTAEFSFTIFFFTTLCVVLTFLGIEAMARATYIILPFALFGIFLVIYLLHSKYILYHLAPWQGPGALEVLLIGGQVSGFNFGLLIIPLMGRSFQSTAAIRQASLYGFSLSITVRTITILSYCLTFGSSVAREKVLPFFEMVRLAYASRYLQRLEALFILLWVMAGVLAIAVAFYTALYIIAQLFKLPSIQPLIVPMALIAAELAMLPEDITKVITLHAQLVSTWYNVGSLAVPLLLVLAALLKKGRKRKICSSARLS